MSAVKRILVTAGGTAGHIYPAVAIIEYLQEFHKDVRVLYLGTKKGMESRIIRELGIDFTELSASGFSVSRSYFKKALIYMKFALNLAAGFFEALAAIIRFKPDFIIGMGGYVCAPVFIAAMVWRKPIAIHEQNYIPGRLNKVFSKHARYVFLSFKESAAFFKQKNDKIRTRYIFTGNPVRKQIRDFKQERPEYEKWDLKGGRFTITAFGGSLGAEKINSAVFSLYDYFRDDESIQVVLICGTRFFTGLKEKLNLLSKPSDKVIFKILEYVDQMEQLYRITDLVIARSGATTVAELAIVNIPAILIPYPQAIENHQYYNAEFLSKNNKAILIEDKELNSGILLSTIVSLLENEKKKYIEIKKSGLNIRDINSAKIISEKILGI
jgi:UDP-N-acetylglucosamine--N-acetylmuramyl-(pentapeptide) pyrophosphoryl-undecaprenol N-acetylglucosamine transferase